MFLTLLIFEIRDRLRRFSSLVYFLLFLSLSFLLGITFAGAFKGASVNFGLSNKLALNSPVVLNYLTSFIGYISLLVVAPLFGQSINKDFESKFSQILFATPLKRGLYFFVRYLGSFVSSLAILSSIGLGLWIATYMPFIDRTLVGANRLEFYLAPYVTNLVPNTLVFGAIFISVVSIFKKMAPVYVASIAVFTGWLISQALTSDLENKTLAALIEPLGLEAASQVVRYWSVAEQSTRLVPVTGILLTNRLLWAAIGLAFLAFGYFSFDPFRLPKEKPREAELPTTASAQSLPSPLPSPHLRPHSVKVFLGLALSEFKQAFSNIFFGMILLCGILYIFAISGQIGKMYGTETLPVTYHVLEVIGGSFGLFGVILTTFYAGELVWKDRDQHFFELVDSKPVSNLYLYLSKLLALSLIQLLIASIVFVCCLLIQTFKGYTHYELDVYFAHLIAYSLPAKLMTCVLALFLQSLVTNKYVGHALMILYWLALGWLPSVGLDHQLYLVGLLPRAPFSDMNRFGTSAWPFTVFAVYWGFFHLALAVLTVLLWRRGMMKTARESWKELCRRFHLTHALLLTAAFAGFVGSGSYIFYNTNILNRYERKSELEQNLVDYEHFYKSFETVPQPELQSVKLNVDLFPETQSATTKGNLKYKNKTSSRIEKIVLNLDKNAELVSYSWSRPARIALEDTRLECRVFELEAPLLPNEELELTFETRIRPRGFKNEVFSKKIVQNGTFLHNYDFVPSLGYQTEREISEEKTRRKYGLPERPRMPNVNDPVQLNRTYISNEGSWIDFETTLSTSADQIALAPGYLEKEWSEAGRRYFKYKMDRPILNFYSILSARYAVTRDEWNGVKIEVYHHPTHTVDVPRMINSVKKSLEYFSDNFSPYQYRQFRILEFPRYELFAQAFPNTIPFSEGTGFIIRVREGDPESIDAAFYVTSHEAAHQWWAHQVIGANVQGSTMLSESLAQYSSLMVQEKEYGPRQMRKFLKYELDRYLNGRSRETKKELPLALNENQLYIHYQKGSLIFYALKDYLGEKVVNGVLREFVKEHAFKGPPFPRAIDLVAKFRAVTPPELKYLIEDFFETVTLYDTRTDSVVAKKVGAKYHVTLKGFAKKLRADDAGVETEVPMNDLIDVGLFDKNGEILYLKKHVIKSGETTVEVDLESPPAKGGFDPLNKLIDRTPDDNQVKVRD